MNLLKALAAISSMTLISRVLGFARDAIIARVFGAGFATDAFFVAFKLPNLLRRIFAEGAFSQAFVPILTENKQKQSLAQTRQFLSHITGALSLVLGIVTAVGMLIAPWIIYISAPGFVDNPEKLTLTVTLLRITFPYILFISLASLVGSVLNTYSQFTIPAFTPTLLNLSFIGFALCLTPYFHPPIVALAWAVTIGGMLQLLFQLPYLSRLQLLALPRLNWRDKAVWRVIKHMGPAIFGVSVSQISLILNTIFASFLISGSVSWMYYADRLMEFPTGVLGVALGTILLPSLSRSYANADTQAYSLLLDWGLRLSLLLALPAAVGLAVIAHPLVTSLFYYGKFTLLDVLMTEQALIAYSVGLLGLILVKVLAPGFYARHDIRTPVKIAMGTLLLTQLMNLAFIWHLQHVGLALAIGLGACLNAALLLYTLLKRQLFLPQPGWLAFLVKLGVAVVVMAMTLYMGMLFFPSFEQGVFWLRCFRLLILVLLGMGGYFITLTLLGFRPRHFIHRVSAQ
jgi:putative peptidoglycan lipid II flippase